MLIRFADSFVRRSARSAAVVWAVSAPIAGGGLFVAAPAAADNPCAPHWDVTIGQPGMEGPSVRSVAEYNGNLFAGGNFWAAGGQTVNRIARWNGSSWEPIVAGGEIGVGGVGGAFADALIVYNGDLIVGGHFLTAGGQAVNRIARWDGSAWHPLESGGQIGTSGTVSALSKYDGDLIAGGWFTTAGGQTVNYIARWDGVEWHPFFSGNQAGVGWTVRALTVYNGDLIVGGQFTTAGGQKVNNIARWDGSAWHPLKSNGQVGVDHYVETMRVYDGDLIVGGRFTTAGGQAVNRIARWDGSKWHPFTSGGQIGVDGAWVEALTEYNDDLIVGGALNFAGGLPANRIAAWHAPEPADLNCDGVVNVLDLLILLENWGPCDDSDDCPANLNDDGVVNVLDLLILLENWG